MPLDDPNAALDAAARKKLPIWLRQGLEKMENEKQKKEQDQIRAKLREEKLRKKRELELNRSPQRYHSYITYLSTYCTKLNLTYLICSSNQRNSFFNITF